MDGRGTDARRLAFCRSLIAVTLCTAFWLHVIAIPGAAQPPCVGDCNGDRQVSINELVLGVNIALGVSPVSACPAFDPDNSGMVSVANLVVAVNNALLGCPPRRATPTATPAGPPPTLGPPTPVITFSQARECQQCHARQFDEWRTSPHAYTGISPTFWSLMAAGQNSNGAGAINADGVAIGGAVGNFCAPCHGPLAYVGATGSLGGNNAGFGNVAPEFPFVCANRLLSDGVAVPCTVDTAAQDCSVSGQPPQTRTACIQFEGRSCINAPPMTSGSLFPRRLIPCGSDSECQGLGLGCANDDCGPCIIAPSTTFFSARAQEGINCETCHNLQQNFRRGCQMFRNSDSVATFSYELASRTQNGGRLRLGPYPVGPNGSGREADRMTPVPNPFHASSAVGSPFTVPYSQTDRPNGVPNPNPTPFVIHRSELTCGELPYCNAGRCEGGPDMGATCGSDADCGGCGPVMGSPELGPRCGGMATGSPCLTSSDCGRPSDANKTLLDRGVEQGTIGPLTGQLVGGTRQIDRPDGDFFRSGTMCATCHDVRPPFVNAVLRSCQLQKTQVCGTDDDCRGLNIGCPGNNCGPCVAENNTGLAIGAAPNGTADPRNTGYRRVENLFSEWQISLYNHPELTFCRGDSFKACTRDGDCGADGPCSVRSPYGRVVTCQDCHMSKFPVVPLIAQDGTVTPANDLYAQDLVALEGSQTDPTQPLPRRRVSTHFMSGVDLPLVVFPGQSTQATRRQQLVDSAFRISLDQTPARAQAGDRFEVEVEIENVGVGHRVPAGFSHERQYWVQMYVQEAGALGARDPFDPAAPCNLQRNVATGAVDERDAEGAAALADAGCVYRSGFVLDKSHPETGELQPDGNLRDEDPEDFFVVAGTRVRGNPGTPRIEVRPGAQGRSLAIQTICAEATEEAYRAGIRDGTGIDMGTDPNFPHQVRFCDATKSPGRVPGVTPPGFGNPDCMENGEDLGPCVQEIELSDGNERGRCARNLTKAECESDDECGDDGPCLFRCARLPDLQCCDPAQSAECAAYYATIGEQSCVLDPPVCVGGGNSGNPCTTNAQCPGEGATCGNAGPCNVERRGIVNFQNAFRNTTNGVCVDPDNPRDGALAPIPLPPGVPCGTNLACTLRGVRAPSGKGAVCVINGQCEDGGAPCTNYTAAQDCNGGACNVERNTQLNGRASESVFIQNHPFNFNSLPPFQPRDFTYEFEVPERFRGRDLVVAARIMNRHFPMRFLRNLIGTQVIKPPFIVEAQGKPGAPGQCLEPRQIDIDCYVDPLAILGNAEAGGFVPSTQRTRTKRVTVQ